MALWLSRTLTPHPKSEEQNRAHLASKQGEYEFQTRTEPIVSEFTRVTIKTPTFNGSQPLPRRVNNKFISLLHTLRRARVIGRSATIILRFECFIFNAKKSDSFPLAYRRSSSDCDSMSNTWNFAFNAYQVTRSFTLSALPEIE